jgi:hypothetical protein
MKTKDLFSLILTTCVENLVSTASGVREVGEVVQYHALCEVIREMPVCKPITLSMPLKFVIIPIVVGDITL